MRVDVFVSEAWLELTPLCILFGRQLCRGQSFVFVAGVCFPWLTGRSGSVTILLKLAALSLSFFLFFCGCYVCVCLAPVGAWAAPVSMITTAGIGRAAWAQVDRLLYFCVFLVMQSASSCRPQEASAAAPCCYLAATPDPWAGSIQSNPIRIVS